jgi:hypothetical protein
VVDDVSDSGRGRWQCVKGGLRGGLDDGVEAPGRTQRWHGL